MEAVRAVGEDTAAQAEAAGKAFHEAVLTLGQLTELQMNEVDFQHGLFVEGREKEHVHLR